MFFRKKQKTPTTIIEHLKDPMLAMVVSEEKKFLYLKTPKTAGTSIYRKIIEPEVPDAFQGKNQPKELKKWLANLTQAKLKNYYTFTFVRNPWDRAISNYFYYQKIEEKELTFETFLEKVKGNDFSLRWLRHLYPQHHYAYFNDQLIVDFVGRHETLNEDWQQISRRLNVTSTLTNANTTNHQSYQQYYDANTKQLVAELYAKEIELFKYCF